MKRFSLAAVTSLGLGLAIVAAPAQAANLSWDVNYSGWWEDDATISGSIFADEMAAADGIIASDELTGWTWNWSGNSAVSAFTIASSDENAEVQTFGNGGFYIDGTANLPAFLDNLDQAVFAAGDFVLDLEFLFVQDEATGDFTEGDGAANSGQITIAQNPTAVPEPAAAFGLIAVVGAGLALRKRSAQMA